MRSASLERITKETNIKLNLNADGKGIFSGKSPIPFFDHMLAHFSKYSMIDLNFNIQGDIEIDGHHTVEDTGIVLGQAIKEALGDKKGIYRFGESSLPMDETLVNVAVDFSGRAFFSYRGPELEKMEGFGLYDSELTLEFFQKFSTAAAINLHISVISGNNRHHIHEAIFKATGLAVRRAIEFDPRRENEIPSIKGII
jgi:imidazoleglycerol-phosphate dehydratase